MGHLSRTAAFIYTQQINISECLILSSSPFVDLFFSKEQVQIIPEYLAQNIKELANFVQCEIEKHCFETFYVDTFPLGIVGELQYIDFKNTKLIYLARYLKWEIYASSIKFEKSILFSKSYLFEELSEKHLSFTCDNSIQYSTIQLFYPPKELPLAFKQKLQHTQGFENWLIVHSTPSEEVYALIEHATDLARKEKKQVYFYIVTQTIIELPENVEQIDFFPAYALFPYVDKIFTACGFNLMQQTKVYDFKHIAIPFARRFDNQFHRFAKMKINK